LLLATTLLLLGPGAGHAAMIGYWRMEADLDPSANGFEVANEAVFGTSLLSSEAFVDTLANPSGTVPLTGAPNGGSAGATLQGGPNGINATAAWYPELDVPSITVEFWARTVENQATLFSRSSGNNGIVIANPSSLDVTWWVQDGSGGATQRQILNVYDLDSTWHHFAFGYDAATGLGSFWVDGTIVASNDGPDGRALVWGNQVPVRVGTQMDYAAAFNGTLDEVRISNMAPGAGTNLLVDEPAPAVLAAAGALGLLALGQRRRA
jgi:hypothetical protein